MKTRVEGIRMVEGLPRGSMAILDQTAGHREISWDPDSGEGGALAVVEFNQAVSDGMMGIAVNEDGTLEQVKDFDPKTHERVVLVPQVSGG